MVKCPNCNKELEQLEGTYKFGVLLSDEDAPVELGEVKE